jgi:hypothetical protein
LRPRVTLITNEVNQTADLACRLPELTISASSRSSRNRSAHRDLVSMQRFATTDPKVARRCRYDQHRGQKTTLTVKGSLVTGLVRSVMEVRSPGNPTRWIVTVVAKASIAA